MVGNLQPLDQQFALVDPATGRPTPYFIRWAQARQIDITDGINSAEAQALINAWAAARDVNAGTGLSGGGNLSADVTLNLANTAVTPGSYTNTNLTVDQQGRITAAANGTGGSSGGTTAPTIVQATYAQFTGNGNLVLGAAPTTGNLLVLMWAGPGGGNRANPPADFSLVYWNCHDVSLYAAAGVATGQIQQGFWLAVRRVESGMSATLATTAPSDRQNYALIELDDANVFEFYANIPYVYSTTNYKTPRLTAPKSGLEYVMVEHDGTANPAFTGTDITTLFTFNSQANNHRALLGLVSNAAAKDVVGSFSAAPSLPMVVQIFIGKRT